MSSKGLRGRRATRTYSSQGAVQEHLTKGPGGHGAPRGSSIMEDLNAKDEDSQGVIAAAILPSRPPGGGTCRRGGRQLGW